MSEELTAQNVKKDLVQACLLRSLESTNTGFPYQYITKINTSPFSSFTELLNTGFPRLNITRHIASCQVVNQRAKHYTDPIQSPRIAGSVG